MQCEFCDSPARLAGVFDNDDVRVACGACGLPLSSPSDPHSRLVAESEIAATAEWPQVRDEMRGFGRAPDKDCDAGR